MDMTKVAAPAPKAVGWPSQSPSAMNAYYGNPDANGDFQPDAAWEAANIVKIAPPYALYYPKEEPAGTIIRRATLFKSLRVHRRAAPSLERILKGIAAEFTPAEIRQYELDVCGGVHNFRLMRAGTSLSIHSWGAAIDLSHLINAWKVPYGSRPDMMPMRAVAIFADEGWTWGGLWSTPDAMHFQAATV